MKTILKLPWDKKFNRKYQNEPTVFILKCRLKKELENSQLEVCLGIKNPKKGVENVFAHSNIEKESKKEDRYIKRMRRKLQIISWEANTCSTFTSSRFYSSVSVSIEIYYYIITFHGIYCCCVLIVWFFFFFFFHL